MEQFCRILSKRKKSQLKTSAAVTAAMKTTLTIKVELVECERVWRRFRVPAATSLAVLHDQVLGPVMGWARAYHGYCFEDPVDGRFIFSSSNNNKPPPPPLQPPTTSFAALMLCLARC